MTNLLTILPFALSISSGYLLIKLLLKKESNLSFAFALSLGAGLGLGLNAEITFLSFIFLDQLVRFFVMTTNSLIFLILLILYLRNFPFSLKKTKISLSILKNLWPYLILLSLLGPIYFFAKFYPLGGWDAWSVWNFKAKFLLLSGTNWTNLFSPILWRSSPHYPLLLPLMNVWGWSFVNQPVDCGPLLTAMIFAFTCMLLLYEALKDLTKNLWAILAPLLVGTIPFYLVLATSQYADIVIAYFLLASLVSLIKAKTNGSPKWALIGGLFLGLLSFVKPEGLVACGIILCCSFFYFGKMRSNEKRKKIYFFLFLGVLLSGLITVIFKIFYAPANQTMINGLVSHTKPSDFYRIKAAFTFLFFELKNAKWQGIWFLLLIGLLLTKGRCFNKKVWIIPVFLFLYGVVVGFYYYLNTYFEILWWLTYTVSRILFAVLPLCVFWVFFSLWTEPPEDKN